MHVFKKNKNKKKIVNEKERNHKKSNAISNLNSFISLPILSVLIYN